MGIIYSHSLSHITLKEPFLNRVQNTFCRGRFSVSAKQDNLVYPLLLYR